MNPCAGHSVRQVAGFDALPIGQGVLSDEDREMEIEAARVAMTHALTPDCQRFWFARMRELIAQRSPEQVARMERERGIT